MNMLTAMLLFGGRMFGRGARGGGNLMMKSIKYLVLGPISMLMGGRFNFMDFILIPKIAPMFAGLLGGLGIGTAAGAAGGGDLLGGILG